VMLEDKGLQGWGSQVEPNGVELELFAGIDGEADGHAVFNGAFFTEPVVDMNGIPVVWGIHFDVDGKDEGLPGGIVTRDGTGKEQEESQEWEQQCRVEKRYSNLPFVHVVNKVQCRSQNRRSNIFKV